MTNNWRAYLIREGNLRYELSAWHGCCLMGIRCPECDDIWAASGISYPSIDCLTVSSADKCVSRHLLDIAEDQQMDIAKDPQIMSLQDYEQVRSALAPILGDRRPLMPGVDFGHLRGEGAGTFGDFAWPDSWTPVVRKSVFEDMLDAGFDLTGVPAALKLRGGKHDHYIEIEAPPTARLSALHGMRICGTCGRPDVNDFRRIIDAASFDDSIPVQRILEYSTTVVVNALFAEYIRDRSLTEVTVTPLHVE